MTAEVYRSAWILVIFSKISFISNEAIKLLLELKKKVLNG